MDSNELHETLARLHQELAATASVDAETRALLGEIVADIGRLNSPAAAPSPASRLEGVAVQFEADHPALAASLRRLIDLLGQAGV